MFIGDTITGRAEVLSVHETKLAVSVVRQDGEEVLTGKAWCYRFLPGSGGS